MPFKHNAARRHRIPKVRHRVTNWPAYEDLPRATSICNDLRSQLPEEREASAPGASLPRLRFSVPDPS
jgi:hypothetical protein